MALKKSEKRLLMMLAPLVGFFLFDKLVLSSKPKNSAPAPASVQSAVPALKPPVQVSANGNVPPIQAEFKDWGRDPFGSVASAPAASSGGKKNKSIHPSGTQTVLSGIFRKQGKAFALINDEVYAEGEERAGIRVIKIEEDRVLCSAHGSAVTLYWRDLL